MKRWRKQKPLPLSKQIIALEGTDRDFIGKVANILSTHYSCYVVPNYLDGFLEMVQRDMNENEIRRVARGQENSINEYLEMKGDVIILDRSYMTLAHKVESVFGAGEQLDKFRNASNKMYAFWIGNTPPDLAGNWQFQYCEVGNGSAQDVAEQIVQFMPQSQPLSK